MLKITSKLTLSLILIASLGNALWAMTADEVIEQIRANVNTPWNEDTVDTIKAGDADTEITGIIACMFATWEVLQTAAKTGHNLIITHEPTFYNHRDETDFLSKNPVYLQKRQFIEDNNLVIFRFHDHIHRHTPDGIYVGMHRELGWKDKLIDTERGIAKLPKQSLAELLQSLKAIYGKDPIRYIGRLDMELENVSLVAGAPGSRRQIATMEHPAVDVLIIGESPEWETMEYARDAVQQGRNKALIILGHIATEQAGMEWCAEWVKGFLDEMPIQYVPIESPYDYFQ